MSAQMYIEVTRNSFSSKVGIREAVQSKCDNFFFISGLFLFFLF